MLVIQSNKQTYFRMEGCCGKPAILLLHPIGFDHSFWDQIVPKLHNDYVIFRPDLPGHGASDLVAEATISAFADAVIEVVDAISIDTCIIAGVSLGAFVGMVIAATIPDRVKALILTSAGLDFPEPEGGWAGRLDMVAREPMSAAADRAGARLLSSPSIEPPVAAMLHRVMQLNNKAGYLAALTALREADMRPLIANLTSPTLILSGGDPTGRTTRLASALNAPVHLLNAGHMPPVECPQAYTDAVTRFLESLR